MENKLFPSSWVKDSITPDAPHLLPSESFGYGYQWWITDGDSREFYGHGCLWSSNMYINPETQYSDRENCQLIHFITTSVMRHQVTLFIWKCSEQ